MTQRKTAITKR